MYLLMRLVWSTTHWFALYSCRFRCHCWNCFGRGEEFHQSSNSRCLVSFGPLITEKSIAFIQLKHMCLLMHLVWSSISQFAFYSCQFRCFHWDSFRRGGGIPSIFKQPLLCEFWSPDHETLLGEGGIQSIFKQLLLGEFWSPDHNKKHSIHPIKSYVIVDLINLVINAWVCLLQLVV